MSQSVIVVFCNPANIKNQWQAIILNIISGEYKITDYTQQYGV